MSERDGYIPGVPCWIDTTQPDPDAAAVFYGGLFGWELEDAMPPDAPGKYLMARIRGGDVAGIGSAPEGAPPRAVWNTYVQVQSADDTAATVREAGGTVLMEPFDVMDAGRMAVFGDPEGAVFCVWQPDRHKGARVINEHGALNFNGLATAELETAKRFYGSVFGWQVLSLDGFQAWTLPAYGDHLEELQPGNRRRTAEMGVPGFENVVASIEALPPDAPPHWSVTFSVDNADETAERAAELGGEVLAAPFDAPWVRMTVLSDPQGATFVASQFVPPEE
ncbi:MAG: VOC family protein [Acidobacteriota bacterium]|nr:VOC family protein [Acidobacteriota bacterium]